MKDQIISGVVSALNSVHSRLKEVYGGRKMWTEAVLYQLCLASKKIEGIQCCPDPDNLNPAWLYDMVWYRMDGECLSETPLVLESEWDTRMSYVRYDLEKLLLAKASVKVMIVDADCGDIESLIEDEIKSFKGHLQDECYLLVKWFKEYFEYTLFDGSGERKQLKVQQ